MWSMSKNICWRPNTKQKRRIFQTVDYHRDSSTCSCSVCISIKEDITKALLHVSCFTTKATKTRTITQSLVESWWDIFWWLGMFDCVQSGNRYPVLAICRTWVCSSIWGRIRGVDGEWIYHLWSDFRLAWQYCFECWTTSSRYCTSTMFGTYPTIMSVTSDKKPSNWGWVGALAYCSLTERNLQWIWKKYLVEMAWGMEEKIWIPDERKNVCHTTRWKENMVVYTQESSESFSDIVGYTRTFVSLPRGQKSRERHQWSWGRIQTSQSKDEITCGHEERTQISVYCMVSLFQKSLKNQPILSLLPVLDWNEPA